MRECSAHPLNVNACTCKMSVNAHGRSYVSLFNDPRKLIIKHIKTWVTCRGNTCKNYTSRSGWSCNRNCFIYQIAVHMFHWLSKPTPGHHVSIRPMGVSLSLKGIVHLNIIFLYMKFNKICSLDHPVY